MLSSQVTQVAQQANAVCKVVSNAEQLIADCQSMEVQQVILDLNSSANEVGTIVRSIREAVSTVRVIAIAPHVHTEKIKNARESGCDEVLTKGQFHSTMQDWFRAGS